MKRSEPMRAVLLKARQAGDHWALFSSKRRASIFALARRGLVAWRWSSVAGWTYEARLTPKGRLELAGNTLSTPKEKSA